MLAKEFVVGGMHGPVVFRVERRFGLDENHFLLDAPPLIDLDNARVLEGSQLLHRLHCGSSLVRVQVRDVDTSHHYQTSNSVRALGIVK